MAQEAFNVFQLTAHDRGIKAVVRDLRVLREESHRRVSRDPVSWPSTDVMIGTRVLEESGDGLRMGALSLGGRAIDERLLQGSPIRITELQRDRMLDITQDCRLARGFRVH